MLKPEPGDVFKMFLFFTKSEAVVLINSVLRQNTACRPLPQSTLQSLLTLLLTCCSS